MDDLINIVSLQLGERDVSPKSHFVEDLGAESMDIVNIIAAVEDKFSIKIREDEISDIRTLTDLHRLIEEKHS